MRQILYLHPMKVSPMIPTVPMWPLSADLFDYGCNPNGLIGPNRGKRRGQPIIMAVINQLSHKINQFTDSIASQIQPLQWANPSIGSEALGRAKSHFANFCDGIS